MAAAVRYDSGGSVESNKCNERANIISSHMIIMYFMKPTMMYSTHSMSSNKPWKQSVKKEQKKIPFSSFLAIPNRSLA